MPTIDAINDFRTRVLDGWLPTYCHDPKRQYAVDGFRASSIKLSEADARDCMRAIEFGVVKDTGGGRYKAPRSTAFEQLFWEGSRDINPRPITLWLEPVITFASLARLHFDYHWPIELLGTQPRTWAFDLAAHAPEDPASYRILGEVKKTLREAEALLLNLRLASDTGGESKIPTNSFKKWKGLLAAKPPVVWIVGPAGYSKVLACTYLSDDQALLVEVTPQALNYDAVGRSGIMK